MYSLGIFTSFYDDYALILLETIDRNIENGVIRAEPFLVSNVREDQSPKVQQRVERARRLRHLGKNIVFFPSRDFKPDDYSKAKKESAKRGRDSESMKKWRLEYDRALMQRLPKADSYLNIGYMQIISEEMCNKLDIVNLHPAVPEVGPIGMWPNVMEEQAERAIRSLWDIKGLEYYPVRYVQDEMKKRLNQRENKAGGMLHFVTPEPDRGPVIAYYELALTSPELMKRFAELANMLKTKRLGEVKQESAWEEVAGRNGLIRKEQFKGEGPLLVKSYENLTHDRWKIENRILYTRENGSWVPYPNGVCLNHKIGEYLKERGIESLIG